MMHLRLCRRLYRFMPVSWSARLLLAKPNEADVEWAGQATMGEAGAATRTQNREKST